MPTDILIRPYQHPDDRQGVIDVSTRVQRIFYWHDLDEELKIKYQNIPQYYTGFLVAEKDGEIIATCGIEKKDDGHEGEYFLRQLYVDQPFQKQGVGSTILAGAIEWCRQQGAKIVTLTTRTDEAQGEAVVKWYLKRNFVIDEERTNSKEFNPKGYVHMHLPLE